MKFTLKNSIFKRRTIKSRFKRFKTFQLIKTKILNLGSGKINLTLFCIALFLKQEFLF